MQSLLDVNVLIALFDSDHTLHEHALRWFREHAGDGWSTCPITQNGCLRIMSSPGYPNAFPIRAIAERLAFATQTAHHEFWSDDITFLDSTLFDLTRIHGPRQVTDVYLLSLAVRHKGRFVTFDSSVGLDAVKGAKPKNLCVL